MRKICIVTGTRAEYGLLYWLMKEIENDEALQLQLIVTGMHLSPEFGLTYKLIEQDGFHIDTKVEMVLSSDTPVGIAKSIGLGVIGFSEALDRLQPDIMVILGDRYEMLSAVQAALVANIPVAHISGGETTEGAIDEAIRHSITKMSHLHFVGAEPYRQRVIQLGEQPNRVFNVGDPAIDNILKMPLLSKYELEKSLNFKLGESFFIVTYHPVTVGNVNPQEGMRELLGALDLFPNVNIIICYPNSDTGGRILIDMINEYAALHPHRVYPCASLGQLRYLSAMKHCQVVIGNSSSGIAETPAFKKATVNIGTRQQGRLKAHSIIDCNENCGEIEVAIQKALSFEFQETLRHVKSLYDGDGNTSCNIKDVLKKTDLAGILMKKFYDCISNHGK